MPFAIDLFCGAGGFSEGILQAGFNIVFSSDKSSMVQKTYMNRHEQLGLHQGIDTFFELADIKDLSSELIFDKINSLKYGNIFSPKTIDVMFGGPPCQGFSRLGKRDSNDPRNMLFHEYLRLIKDIQPKYVVMENVTGITDLQMLDFPSVLSDDTVYEGQNLVPFILREELEGLGYMVPDMRVLNSAHFGVPQRRNRAIFLAYRSDVAPINYPEPNNNIVTSGEALGNLNNNFEESNFSRSSVIGRTLNVISGCPIARSEISNMETSQHSISVRQRFSLYNEGENKKAAVQRLERTGLELRNSSPELFFETLYHINSETNWKYIKENFTITVTNNDSDLIKRWMHDTNKVLSLLHISKLSDEINSSKNNFHFEKLANRLSVSSEELLNIWPTLVNNLNKEISETQLINSLEQGDFSDAIVEALFTKKGIRMRLNSNSVAPTMVTLPDDFIHPTFDRILTVREMARFQSFDDSFEFLGKRTTGGSMRAKETPQFTQVGNAIPPLLARAIADEAMIAIKNTDNII